MGSNQNVNGIALAGTFSLESENESAREAAGRVQPLLLYETRSSRFVDGGAVLEIEYEHNDNLGSEQSRGVCRYAREGTPLADAYLAAGMDEAARKAAYHRARLDQMIEAGQWGGVASMSSYDDEAYLRSALDDAQWEKFLDACERVGHHRRLLLDNGRDYPAFR